jgi:hypothetical protein
MTRSRRVTALALCVVAAVVCWSLIRADSAPKAAPTSSHVTPTLDNRTVNLPFQVDVTGGVMFSYDSTTPLQLMRMLGGSDKFVSQRLLSVGLTSLVRAPDGNQFKAGFDLTGYDGKDGPFTIQPGSVRDAVLNSEVSQNSSFSQVVFSWVVGNDFAGGREFRTALKPCTGKTTGRGIKGTLTCPSVTDENRTTEIAITMSWG